MTTAGSTNSLDQQTSSSSCISSAWPPHTQEISGFASSHHQCQWQLASGILGSTAASSLPSPSRRKGKTASPHSFQQLSSTYLKTASCRLSPLGTNTVLPRDPRSQASLHTAGAMQSSALCSKSIPFLPQAQQGWGHCGTEYPRQDMPAQPGSMGTGREASPALPQQTKAPCFPPCSQGGWSCPAQPSPGRLFSGGGAG